MQLLSEDNRLMALFSKATHILDTVIHISHDIMMKIWRGS